MIMHQRTFYCKVGHADAVVQIVKDFRAIVDAVSVQAHGERVYTDLTGMATASLHAHMPPIRALLDAPMRTGA
jgi:hypothetical protein